MHERAPLQLRGDFCLVVVNKLLAGFGIVFGAVFDLVERHLGHTIGSIAEVELERRAVDGVGRGGAVEEPQAIALLLFGAEQPVRLDRLNLEGDDAIVGQLHERRHEGPVGDIAVLHEGGDDRRMVSRGDIAEVGLLEHRLGAAPPRELEIADDGQEDRRDRHLCRAARAHDGARLLAAGIGLVGPRLLLFEDGRQAPLTRRGKRRHPRRREDDARLGELTGLHTGHLHPDPRHVGVEGNRSVEGPVPPRTQVLPRLRCDPRIVSTCKADEQTDVFGIVFPIRTDELPVQLGGVGPGHDRAGQRVADSNGERIAIVVGREHLDQEIIALDRRCVDALLAVFCRIDALERPRPVAIDLVDRHTRDRHRRHLTLLVANEGDRPKHAVDVIVRLKQAAFAHLEVAVCLHLGLNFDIVGIRGRMCPHGQGDQNGNQHDKSRARAQQTFSQSHGEPFVEVGFDGTHYDGVRPERRDESGKRPCRRRLVHEHRLIR